MLDSRIELKHPHFILSIDMEMPWGPSTSKERALMVWKPGELRTAVERLLELMERFEIRATWTIVGHLFLEHCDRSTCATARYIALHGCKRDWYPDSYSNMSENPLYYGRDIVEKVVANHLRHEIGYHSFSHPTFTEIPIDMAEEEISLSRSMEREWGSRFKSFVFPTNKIAYVDLPRKYEFRISRGAPAGKAVASKLKLLKKISGASDKIASHPVTLIWRDGIWEIQSSMLSCDSQIPQTLLLRSRIGIERTISSRKVFHVFLHPWNILCYRRLLRDFEKLLRYVSDKREEGEIEVITMGEFADRPDNTVKVKGQHGG
jgi:hypothetical protein